MLTNNPTQMDSYNKHAKPGQGINYTHHLRHPNGKLV